MEKIKPTTINNLDKAVITRFLNQYCRDFEEIIGAISPGERDIVFFDDDGGASYAIRISESIDDITISIDKCLTCN